MTQKALCEKISCSAGNMAFLMRKLTERGLVERKTNGEDERSREVELTREGREVIMTVYPRHANVVRALTATLKVREQETLERLCRKLEAGDPLRFMRELTMVDD
jgi:MarR family transcriptional regulator, 2-MHQ and catechol-resistance regulon repressor